MEWAGKERKDLYHVCPNPTFTRYMFVWERGVRPDQARVLKPALRKIGIAKHHFLREPCSCAPIQSRDV